MASGRRRGGAGTAGVVAAGVVVAVVVCAGCALSLPGPRPTRSGVVAVAAAENVWGSIAAQVGGAHVHVTSIITNPATDPHDYEPTPADARALADARLVLVNGVGYDGWASRLLAADGGTVTVLDVGRLLGVPAGANPHRWYDPADVLRVVAGYAADLARLDPAQAGYFRARARWFADTALHRYRALLAQIRRRFAGTPVGASESVVAPLAAATGLRLVTPATFLRAVSEGSDVSTADTATIDRQIARRAIRVYLLNTQNVIPDVAAQVAACRAHGIPVVAVTETLQPAAATFQSWQAAQLLRLRAALAAGGAR